MGGQTQPSDHLYVPRSSHIDSHKAGCVLVCCDPLSAASSDMTLIIAENGLASCDNALSSAIADTLN